MGPKKALKSKSRLLISHANNLPKELELHDIGIIFSVLLHIRDPFLALVRMCSHINEKIVIEINSPVKFKQLLLMEDKDELTTKSAALAYEKHLTIQIGIKSDSHWKKIPPKSSDKVHESHWVNVRTNPKYNVDSKYAKISGKDIWYSEPFNVADKFDDAIRDKIRDF